MRKKTLVIQMKMIGDVLTSSILFEAIRQNFPSHELHYLIQPHTSKVVENNPFIDRLILFDPEEYKGVKGLLKFGRQIRAEKYDMVIDVYAKINSAIITGISGAKLRISYSKWYTSPAYTKTFDLKKEPLTNAGVAIENRMLLLKGIDGDFPLALKPKIYLTANEKAAGKQKLLESGIDLKKPLFMIAVLGSSEEKSYPGHFMAEVLDHLVETTNAQLVFNYNPKQLSQARSIIEKSNPKTRKHAFPNIFGNNLREFLALTAHCDALIGNEGGAVNMAKALNIPTFAIFSPQIEKKVWAVFQDELNVAVHIDDYSDDVNAIPDGTKYEMFKPALLIPQLNNFLDKLQKI